MFSKFKKAFCLIIILCMLICGCSEKPIKVYSSTGKYVLINKFSPMVDKTFESGSIIVVSVSSKEENLNVTASFCGETITLKKELINTSDQDAIKKSEEINYISSFTLPFSVKDKNLGQIKFTCTLDNITEVYYSGVISILKSEEKIESSSNSPVGEKYIAEVLNVPAETFNGDTVDDVSLPTNSYLPVGTVDYCSSASIVNETIEKSYRLLRFGKRIYDNDNIKIYEGKLPSTNSLTLDNLESNGKYTVMSFYTDWKAPFTVSLKEQEFIDSNNGDFRIKEATYSYIEIRFMYCNEILGNFDFGNDNPLFTSAEVCYEKDCAILKINLKEAGNFYGWRAEYDQEDYLNIRFLQPTRIYTAQNEYGYALYDKVIVVDAGHGGKDPGGVSDGLYESTANLSLAYTLKDELEKLGATVILTRSVDTTLNSFERSAQVLKTEPDFLISIHRNGGPSNGFGAYYYNPFSASASEHIYKATAGTDLYRKSSGSTWHYFFLNRIGICPSVLTENGYLNDEQDRENMRDSNHQISCAKALTRGIVNYFVSQHS